MVHEIFWVFFGSGWKTWWGFFTQFPGLHVVMAQVLTNIIDWPKKKKEEKKKQL